MNNKVYISSRYGNRKHPITGAIKFHSGVDIVAPEGTLISATKNGIVERCKAEVDKKNKLKGYGYYVRLKHIEGDARITYSEYGHLKELPYLLLGQEIKKGDIIGYVGNTGDSTGAHLHYTRRIKDSSINGTPFAPPREEIAYLLAMLEAGIKK